MFLITRVMFETKHREDGSLMIEPYNEHGFLGSFYYFRLGGINKDGDLERITDDLIVPKNGLKHIWSLENFILNKNVLGLIGNISTFVERGLQLIFSPSIDPGFSGHLSLSLKNNTSRDIYLKWRDNIGKVIFFDVSESHVDVEEFIHNVEKEADLKARKEITKKINALYKEEMAKVLKGLSDSE